MSKRPGPLNKFAPHGLPAKVITFFMANPEETLTYLDIANKFGAIAHNVRTQLRPAVVNGSLLRAKDDGGSDVYSAGPALAATQITTKHTPHGAYQKTLITAAEIEEIQPEKGVPPPLAINSRGQSKWDSLFGKLSEPGLSLPIKVEWYDSLAPETWKRNKKGEGHPQYLVRKTSPTTARLWRTK